MRKIFLIIGIILIIFSIFSLFVSSRSQISEVSLIAFPASEPTRTLLIDSEKNGYLIIAPRRLIDMKEMAEFISHKQMLGFKVEIVSVEHIKKTYGFPDVADSIKKYLTDNSQRLELKYLLLVGNPDPLDVRIKLPVTEKLPEYIVSAPSRTLGGTYASDEPDGKISGGEKGKLVLLTGPNLQVLSSGTLRYWYANCTGLGQLRFFIFRREDDSYRKVFDSGIRNVRKTGVAYTGTPQIEIRKGDFLGFLLPDTDAVSVGTVKTPGIACVLIAEPPPENTDIIKESVFRTSLEELPLMQCSIYFEPTDMTGSVPSKMCWPMGTYNGVYGALSRNSCLSQCPTDSYYANLTGAWDSNENGFFGETFQKFFRYDGDVKPGFLSSGDFSGPGQSFLPEILVGRIPFDEPETVAELLIKTISYEKSEDKNWRKSCLLGADPLAPDTDNYALCEFIKRDIMEPAGFSSKRYYTEFDFDGEIQSPEKYNYEPEIFLSLNELTSDLSAGYEKFSEAWASETPGVVVWSSHANTDICRNILTMRDANSKELPSAVTYKYIEKLDDSHPAIVFAVSCSVTQQEPYYLGIRKKRTKLDHNWEPRPNIGRELLKNGAIAFVGPSRSIWFQHGWKEPKDGGCITLAYDFSKQLVRGHAIGDSLAAAIGDYHSRWGSELTHGENLIGFNIYGDPSLSLGVNKKNNIDLLQPSMPAELTSSELVNEGENIEFIANGEGNILLEMGVISEIDKIIAGAEGKSQWFEYEGFQVSGKRRSNGTSSYYSGTGRHKNSRLLLSMPLMPGQKMKSTFSFWHETEPGLDYVFLEQSSNLADWSVLDVYSGASSSKPLFGSVPSWQRKTVEFSTGNSPAYLRFRYVTNDQYRKNPHEGFYMDEFSLDPASGNKVRYLSGWQNVEKNKETNSFSLKNPGPGKYYLRINSTQEKPVSVKSRISQLLISEPRNKYWGEIIRTFSGIFGVVCGLLGLLLLLFGFVTPSKKSKRN